MNAKWTKTREGDRRCNQCGKIYKNRHTFYNHLKLKRCNSSNLKDAPALNSILINCEKSVNKGNTESKIIENLNKIYLEILQLRSEVNFQKEQIHKLLSDFNPFENQIFSKNEIPPELADSYAQNLEIIKKCGCEKNAKNLAHYLCTVTKESTKNVCLHVLLPFCSLSKEPPTQQDYISYFSSLPNRLKGVTVKGYANRINAFLSYEFRWQKKYFPKINYDKYGFAKNQKIPSKTEIENMIVSCSDLKIQLFIWLSFSTGQRPSDNLKLKLSDILKDDDGDYYIRLIASKTQKAIIKYISNNLYELLLKIIKSPTENIFSDLTLSEIRKIFKNLSEKTKFNITPKLLRAAHCTHISKNVKIAQNSLDHGKSKTTETAYLSSKSYKELFEFNINLFKI